MTATKKDSRCLKQFAASESIIRKLSWSIDISLPEQSTNTNIPHVLPVCMPGQHTKFEWNDIKSRDYHACCIHIPGPPLTLWTSTDTVKNAEDRTI